MASRTEVLAAVERERLYQDSKWGPIEKNPHSLPEWLLIMERHVNKGKEAWFSDEWEPEMLGEVIQVVATGFACLEQHGLAVRYPRGLPGWVSVKPALEEHPGEGLSESRNQGV